MNQEQHIAALAAENTYRRTGWEIEACRLDARMMQGVWRPEDSLPVVALMFAKNHQKMAEFLVRLYLKINGKKEVTK